MKLLDKILLPTDFSAAAEEALHTSIQLARRFNTEIILLHAVTGLEGYNQELRRAHNIALDKLHEIQNRIEAEGIRTREPLVKDGAPFAQITWYADCLDVNVIVMGAKGQSTDEDHELGITAAKVMRNAEKPVWVVKPENRQKVERILCPVDFSDPAHHALDNAVHLARDLEAELIVLHVIQPVLGAQLYNISLRSREQQEHIAAEQAQFDRLFDDFDMGDINWRQEIRHGKPHEQILEVAAEIRADLIVMGSLGRTGLARTFMGSVAEKVTRQLPCSVVTVKGQDAIRLQLEAEIADVEARYKQGKELLAEGFPREAIRQFEICVDKDMMFAEGWEALASTRDSRVDRGAG